MPRKPAAAGPKKPTPETKPTKPKAGKAKATPPAAAEPPAERKPTVVETPADPHRLARLFVRGFTDGHPERLRFWNGDYLLWDGAAYRPVPPGDLQCRLTKTVREEFVRLNVEAVAAWRDGGEEGAAPTVKLTTGKIVADAMQAVRGIALLEAYASPPCWIDGGTGPDPAAAVPMANGVLDVAAAAAGRPDCLTPPTPTYFTLTAVPFPFHPAPPPAAEWLKFLASVWPDDP